MGALAVIYFEFLHYAIRGETIRNPSHTFVGNVVRVQVLDPPLPDTPRLFALPAAHADLFDVSPRRVHHLPQPRSLPPSPIAIPSRDSLRLNQVVNVEASEDSGTGRCYYS